MGQQWRVEVDRATCIGSGVCVGNAPQYFRFEDDRSQPVSELVAADQLLIDTAESCPVEAITITEVDSGKLLAPRE